MESTTKTNEPLIVEVKPQEAVPGWVRIFILVIPYLIIVGTADVIGYLIAGLPLTDMGNAMNTPAQTLIVQLFNFMGTALVLFMMMKWVDKEKFIEMGFQWRGKTVDVVSGILVGLILIFAGFLLLYLLGNLKISGMNFNVADLLTLTLIFIFVAFAEEMLMRGYVLKNLMLSMNKYLALIISSLLFSLMHIFNPDFSFFSFIGIFTAGIALGATYIFTQNLWFPIAFHFSWNLFQSLIGFNVSGLDSYSIIEVTPQGAERLSGGAFGFEGSVFSVAFEVLLIVLILLYFKRKGYRRRQ